MPIVPIGTIPGLASALIGVDVLALLSTGAAGRVTRFTLQRDRGLMTGAVTAQLRTATGGGGSGISVTLGVGVEAASVTTPLSFTLAESLYLRVTAADGSSEDLRGSIEVETTGVVTTALTTLARVKTFHGITTSTNDSLINDLIAGVSTWWQRYMRRSIVSQAIASEKHDGGWYTVTLDEAPAIAGSLTVTEDGATIDSASYDLDPRAALVYRLSGGTVDRWARGVRNIVVSYSAGFASVPEDLQLFSTQQVLHSFLQSAPGGGRLSKRGTIIPESGSAEYLIGTFVPGAQECLNLYRDAVRR